MWVEVNLRVNYPIKRALNSLVDNELLDLEDEVTKFAISWVTQRVCHVGCKQLIDSWNSHFVPGSIFTIFPYLELKLSCWQPLMHVFADTFSIC